MASALCAYTIDSAVRRMRGRADAPEADCSADSGVLEVVGFVRGRRELYQRLHLELGVAEQPSQLRALRGGLALRLDGRVELAFEPPDLAFEPHAALTRGEQELVAVRDLEPQPLDLRRRRRDRLGLRRRRGEDGRRPGLRASVVAGRWVRRRAPARARVELRRWAARGAPARAEVGARQSVAMPVRGDVGARRTPELAGAGPWVGEERWAAPQAPAPGAGGGVTGRAHSDWAAGCSVTGSAAPGMPAAASRCVGRSDAGSGSNSTLSSGRSWGRLSRSVISAAMVHGPHASGCASAMTSPNPAPSGRARASIVHSAASLSGRQRSKRAACRSRPPVIWS